MAKPERYLLDTQACYLWAFGKLPPKVLKQLSRPDIVIYYSDLSAWEVMTKRTYVKDQFAYAHFWEFVHEIQAQPHHLTRRDLDKFSDLPFYKEHTDPFDRMIVAQALAANLTLIGGDRQFPRYEGLQILWE
jgi:PIN domain nuclease of toxin-antitoxin system